MGVRSESYVRTDGGGRLGQGARRPSTRRHRDDPNARDPSKVDVVETESRVEFQSRKTRPKTSFERKGLATCLRQVLGICPRYESIRGTRLCGIGGLEKDQCPEVSGVLSGDRVGTRNVSAEDLLSTTWYIYGKRMACTDIPGRNELEREYDLRQFVEDCVSHDFGEVIYVDKNGTMVGWRWKVANDHAGQDGTGTGVETDLEDDLGSHHAKLLVNVDMTLGNACIPFAFSDDKIFVCRKEGHRRPLGKFQREDHAPSWKRHMGGEVEAGKGKHIFGQRHSPTRTP
jgi:hypothetical protein